MTRVNAAIALLQRGLPIFGTSLAALGLSLGASDGARAAAAWPDWIIVDLEHRPYDIAGLARFMEGYAGARRADAPCIGVTLPFDGCDGAAVRANGWIVKQVLATGVHGVTLCHAETPDAVCAMVEAVRTIDQLRITKSCIPARIHQTA